MRTFTLVNGKLQSCNITSQDMFFNNPKGLGFERTSSYRQVGDRWVRVNRKRKQQSITGSVALIGADPYLSYFNFVQFIQSEPLTLLYTPNDQAKPTSPSGMTYRMSVDVSKIEKTEMEKEGYLDCNITFVPKTPWYEYRVITNGKVEGQDEDFLKWGITWGIKWGPLDEYSKGIRSVSYTPSPARLTVHGPVNNPYWLHYVNGVPFEDGRINANILENEYLLVDSTVDPYLIQRRSAIDDSVIADLYPNSDFTTKRFITIQNGGNAIKVEGDNDAHPIVKLEAYIYYESV